MELRRVFDSSLELEELTAVLKDIAGKESSDFRILEIATDQESLAIAKRMRHDRRDAIRRVNLIKQFVKPDPAMDLKARDQFYRSLDFIAKVLQRDAEMLEKVSGSR